MILVSYFFLNRMYWNNTVFDYIKVWFADQNNRPLQIEDDVSLSLIVQNA